MAKHPARASKATMASAQRRSSRREDAERQRERLLVVAEKHFREYGFDRTSLSEIGAALGLTRGAVLYHFGSKADLLATLLEPFVTGLDEALDTLERAAPPARPDEVITVVLDLLTATRPAADLLARDIATRHALDLDAWFTRSAERLVRLLSPDSATDPGAEARGYAALGAMIRPLASLSGPVSHAVRASISAAALDALGRSS